VPTYDYLCKSCGSKFEQFQSITAKPLRKCPCCGKSTLKRLIGSGAAVIFKGPGFYQTDYRTESYKKAAESEKPAAATDDKSKKPAKSKALAKGKDPSTKTSPNKAAEKNA